MIDRLKPYPRMKDSGVPWLGQVPEHWEILPNRSIFNEMNERNHSEEQMLSVTIKKGVIRQEALLSESSKKDSSNLDKSAYKLVEPGDIAYNKMRVWQGAVAVSDFRGIISPAYIVQRIKNGADPRYFHYLFRTPAFAKEAERWSYGITSDMWSLRSEHFRLIYCCLPSPAEQSLIVNFLINKDKKIRNYLSAKQSLIKLLEEQKQAILHQAVTRGLDPDVHLKPSGVEWLGDVPEHWLQTRLKNVATIQTGITLGKNYRGKRTIEYPYLRVANVQNGRLDLKNIKYIATTKSEANSALLRFGDVLMTEGGDIDKLGRGCVWRDEIQGCCHQNHVFAVRCNQEILLPEFLVALITSRHGRNYFQLTAKKTTNLASTNSTVIGSFPIIFPSIPEQKSVTKVLEQITSGLEQAITQALNEISLLREYRTRLIADIVTGKLDVREAAARLPQAPLEPADEVENLLEEENDPDIDQTDETKEVSV